MTRAYVLINSKSPDTDLLAEKIKKVGGVLEAYAVYGSYDIIIELDAKNLKRLRDKIIEIRELEDIGETRTLIQMESGEEDDIEVG
ncbi:MAG: Lrp/AsnC ligand binding domain-containing protein [Theionarchaea archaeon]|nr:Lrp/AsnC ligand binding domain-containing protein [Theionarchaea archaeon]